MFSQVSTEGAADTQSDAQTFTIGVLPQTPGFPQLSPDCDLQITVRDKIPATAKFSFRAVVLKVGFRDP